MSFTKMLGFVIWMAAGLTAIGLARLIPLRRPSSPWLESLIALFAAMVAGMTATALDFGGWAEADPRAFSFALLVSLAAIGLTRIARQRATD